MTDDELIDAYHGAMGGYEAAKAGTGDRLETFARILVAEKVLAARLGRIDLDLDRSGRATHHWPDNRQAQREMPPMRAGEFVWADVACWDPKVLGASTVIGPRRVLRPARTTTPRLGGGVGTSFLGPKLAVA